MQQRQIIKSTDLPITQKGDYSNGKHQAVQFNNNRPENATQLKAQQMANSTVQRQENKTGMPDQLKTGIESLSGMDMSDVNVHYNSSQPAQLQAHAFAQGNQIHLAPGQEKHLPHEAWHVVQQKQGRVTPTKQLKGKININDDSALEKEADVMGAKALNIEKPSTQKPFQNLKMVSSKNASVAQTMRGYQKHLGNKSYYINELVNSYQNIQKSMRLIHEGKIRTIKHSYYQLLEQYLRKTLGYIKKLKSVKGIQIGIRYQVAINSLISKNRMLYLKITREYRLRQARRMRAMSQAPRMYQQSYQDDEEDAVPTSYYPQVAHNGMSNAFQSGMDEDEETLPQHTTAVAGGMHHQSGMDEDEGDLIYHHFKLSVLTGVLHPSLADDASDPDYEPTPQEFMELAEDYGLEAGEEYAKDHHLEAPREEIARHQFAIKAKEDPEITPYFESFSTGYLEGVKNIQEEIKEYGIENYRQWEHEMVKRDWEQLVHEQNLHENFYSTMDNHNHLVYPGIEHEKPDIIVRSNPTPLKQIIDSGKWEKDDITTVKAQLITAQGKAQTALYNIGGNKSLNIKGSRSIANMNALKTQLTSIASLLANVKATAASKAAINFPPTNLTSSTHYGNNSSPTEGIHVKATPLSLKSPTAGSPPHDGRLMTSIRALAGAESKSYKQMHLLNDLVYGPGQLWNLTPGPAKSNSYMEQKIEDPLKRVIMGKGLVINFEAIVSYQNNPNTATDKDIQQNPDKFRFKEITFKATQLKYDNSSDSWKTTTNTDTDISAINNAKVPWQYGSLTPLKPKPRILIHTKNLEQDLKDIGVKPKTAERISKYIEIKGGAGITGEGKKDTLAQKIKEYEESIAPASAPKPRKPDMSGWKASDVLWT